MPTIKLTKSIIDGATPGPKDYELRDTVASGFLCKVTPAGRKVFMLQYRTIGGERRKPAIGVFGHLTVEQARTTAQTWLASVRAGGDPSLEKSKARTNPTVRELTDIFIARYAIPHNKPSTVKTVQSYIKNCINPALGKYKVADVKRPDVAALMQKMVGSPGAANHVLASLKKMFNMAELWGYRADGTNPCRMIPLYPQGKSTRLIKNPELIKLFAYLDRADREGLEHPIFTLAVRLQFAFAARMSEITELRWEWIDFDEQRVVWPDSKTGPMSKPLSDEAWNLLIRAPRAHGSPYVCPAPFKPSQALCKHTYWAAWKRILEGAGLLHVGTHGIRHRAATDIANSGVPIKVGMALTAHKTVSTFMRYVHIEDDQVRDAAEIVSQRRADIVAGRIKSKSPSLRIPADKLSAGGEVVWPATNRSHAR